MSYRVVITPSARADALEGFRWLAERSLDAATRWDAGLQKAIAKLEEHPERFGVAVEESERLEIPFRQMLYGRRRGVYRILFTIEEPTVVVHYIRHSARGPIEPPDSEQR